MKNKPLRHKSENTFKFKPFSDRINEIDIDVFHRVSHRNGENDEEVETYFHETIQKWNVLNLTEGYNSFKKKVRDIVTLPQLLNKKQYVIDTLKESLKEKNILYLQPILELVVAVARDLQKEFYDYFPEFLSIIIDLLQTKDTEQIEYAFATLAYLFKFLWRYLIKNVPAVFNLLLPLLADTQPEYINDFAAQSFAFVVRKVKDKKSFLKFVLYNLKDDKSTVLGCGKLLFEVVSGVPGQFHSCAEQMLTTYFDTLHEESINQKILYNVLKVVIEHAIQVVHPQKSTILWNVLLNAMDTSIEKDKNLQKGRKKGTVLILQILHLVIVYKNGRMLTDPKPLITKLINIITSCGDEYDILEGSVNVSVDILLASNIKLMQEVSSQLLYKVVSVQNIELLRSSVERLINYSAFETLVLPQTLKSSIFQKFGSETLRLYTKIIKEKAPPCLDGIKLNQWRKFALDIPSDNISQIVQLISSDGDITSDFLRSVIIAPHIRPRPDTLENALKQTLVSLHKKLLNYEEKESCDIIDKLAFAFLLSLESTIRVLEPKTLHALIPNSDMINIFRKHNTNIWILNVTDMWLSYFYGSEFHDEYINAETFDLLNDSLIEKLGSPVHRTRLTTTHIYSLFSTIFTIPADTTGKDVMKLMYLAECEPATIQEYRNRLLHLQGLEFHNCKLSSMNSKYYEIPIRYLMGNLYLNFSLLWDPVVKVLSTYATKDCEKFWPLFLAELTSENSVDFTYEPQFDCDVICELQVQIRKVEDKSDFENYKILLWKCMAEFASFCESKNRDLTEIFINFVNSNFFKSNSEDGKSCSIEKHKDLVEERMDTDDDEAAEEKDDVEEAIGSHKETKADGVKAGRKLTEEEHTFIKDGRRQNTKLLLAQMQIFAKMMNPKVLYREPEVRRIYLDLLSSKNPEIQKAALNCLSTYKYKYLAPYEEHLRSLINEKNLKNELARFKIDMESKMVQDEHRADLIPILMRIVYSKMIAKTGMRTGGKAGGLVRRKAVLRFLAGVQEDEMIVFVEMAFKPFHKYITLDSKEDVKTLTEGVISTLDLRTVVPPKRLQSAVNLLGIIMEQFGGKMAEKLLPYLLGLVLCILAMTAEILRRAEEVHSGFLPMIKNVRTSCIALLARFFTHFENYQWSKPEIEALYDVAIFPWLEKLPMEGIHSPTALLKMFMEWSKNPRYFPLFLKHKENNDSLSPLPFIMQLLTNPKAHPSVVNAILEMAEKMLTLQDYGKSEEDDMEVELRGAPLTPILTNLLPINEKYLARGVNYGSTILLPHIPQILAYIKRKIEGPARTVNKTELIILSRVSEFVKEPETCDSLLVLILPILAKKSIGPEETVMELMTTITNLIENVKRPEVHMRSIVPLLSVISNVPARKLLMKLFSTIAGRSTEDLRPTMVKNYKLLNDLNAWDGKWIDQPDFQKRIDAFAEIRNLTESGTIALEFGVAVIHNCFFFLKTETDLAMKDCAGECLRRIGPKLARDYKEDNHDRRFLIDDTILMSIRRGITHKCEPLRLQSIAFLGHMAAECPEVHPVLRDLSLLVNRADPEVDFFENMQHLQLHRKARALLKFCTLSKTLIKPPNPRTLTQFIFPLASSFLCKEEFANKNSVVDAAIEAVAAVCRLLPWYHYEIILKYYLNKLRSSIEFQKQLVRLIVAILDSFHYDLSKYKPVDGPAQPEAPPQETVATEDDNEKAENLEDTAIETNEEAEEKIKEALNDDVGHPDEVEEKEEEPKVEIPAAEKQTLLSQYGARRVIFGISKGLLPQLHRTISARTRRDESHKVNRKKTLSDHEEESLMRVPIALALVKLLQKLPKGILDANLPGILMKLCTFLKSRLESVRRVTREILQKIMITLGPEYLYYLLRELNTLLTKGFQVHVLAYTIHSVLVALKPYFKPHQIDRNLQSILSVCKIDLFGFSSEEKEAAGIVKNVVEAKSTKSFDIFHILAEFITESCMLDLILPLKEVLSHTHSHKTIRKIVECLRNVVLGLADNTYIPLPQVLIFLYGVVSEKIPELMPVPKKEVTEKEAEVLSRKKPDCFIIPPEPKNRMGIKAAAKTSKNTNAYILIEFGLKLFHILLKRDKISDVEFISFLDPYVPILSDCLKSQHVKLCTIALQCLNWILKMDLPSVENAVPEICSSMFDILHRYAAAGLSKGDNFDLVMAAFKCMSVLVRDVKHFTINNDQLKALILYAEQDLHDSDKQATAFTLLKAIISRKLIIPEMHDVLQKVATLSVASELEHVRQQSRSLFYTYLMEYPLGKRLDKFISFYLSQLNFEVQSGRLSALEMLHSMITGFPQKVLVEQSGLLFLTMGARLVNDEDPTSRKLCAKYIKEMLLRIPQNERSKLFDVVLVWMVDKKIMHRTLAMQLCGIFVTVEKDGFDTRLKDTIPLILKQFHADVEAVDEPGRFVKLQRDNEHPSTVKDPERSKDHHLFQVLQLLLKLSVHCKAFLRDARYKQSVRSFSEYIQFSLAHPHLWVRFSATQFIGFVLSALDINKVVKLLNNGEECDPEDGYIYCNTAETLRSLTLDLVAQLHTDMEFEELADQVVKNLIFLAGIFKSVERVEQNGSVENSNELTLHWLMKKLRKCINVEITQAPKSTSVRTAVFKWIAGVVATVPTDRLKPILPSLMSPLVREMSLTEEMNLSLRRLAKEVSTVIKKHIGGEDYIKLLNKVQQTLDVRRAEKKKVRLQQFVTDPELAAKRKIARQQKKKDAKKRKQESFRGKPTSKKRHKKENDDEML